MLLAEQFEAIVAEIRGEPSDFVVEEVGYSPGSPATGGLHRVRGAGWSIFVKQLHHVRHWQRLHLLPEAIRADFAARFPWRMELDAWQPGFADRLPPGMRLPELYQVTDLGDDRLLVWMEDIDTIDGRWATETFARAAYLLGGLAARRRTPEILAGTGLPPGYALRNYYSGRVALQSLPALEDDGLWEHPLLRDTADPALRADLRRLGPRLPQMLDRLDALPQAVPHGDASPQNLLIPKDNPDEFVVIDISFQSPHAVGFDLGQLLIGLVHAGLLPASALPETHDVMVPAFTAGMKDHGADVTADEVEYGYLASLLVRAGYTSIPFELLAEPGQAEVFRERMALTRFIVDAFDMCNM